MFCDDMKMPFIDSASQGEWDNVFARKQTRIVKDLNILQEKGAGCQRHGVQRCFVFIGKYWICR